MAVRIERHAEPIPGYRLLERLGGGGFGEVWKCEAPGGLLKAIKFVYGDLSHAGDDGARAEQELKALSRVKSVRHPYILSLERYEVIDGQLLIVMELADRNLWDRFKECRSRGLPGIPRDELLGYLAETAEVLDLMNEQYQLQHLDIKPHNLFLVHQHVKVADFGLVKDLEGMKAAVTGGVTPIYAAPETFDGWVSRYSDQYSLAIVYQELLTGQRPFSGTNVRQLILQHLQAPPNLAPLPASDRAVVARALAKEPEGRHPSCQAVAQALREAGDHAGRVRAEGPGEIPAPVTPSAGLAAPEPAGAEARPSELVQTVNLRARPTSGSHPGTATASDGQTTPRAVTRPSGSTPRRAAAEVHGDGALFPAVVVGLGQMGLQVLQGLREAVQVQLGAAAELPLRLLLVDTDPETLRRAVHAEQAPGRLPALDVVPAPLNRPSHYLKGRTGRPPLEQWIQPRMLYRIPRAPATTGLRALGRLAFCDNYPVIARRLKAALEAVLQPELLASAARATGLGVRTSRPRVYVVCALGGGTGSGMFLDLAYTARALLDRMGFEQPEVVGLLLVPPAEAGRARTLALGNAHAALTELAHYGRPDTCFNACYLEREPALSDSGPPLGRCVLLPLGGEADEAGTRAAVGLAGQYLFRDVCTPLGRAADLARAGLSAPPWESRGLHYQTFGLLQLSWPRRQLCEHAARRLCPQLVQRWLAKDGKPVREAVHRWVEEQWAANHLGAESFIPRLAEATARRLGRAPEGLLQEAVQPPAEHPEAPERPSGGRGRAAEVDPEEVAAALARLEELLGKPTEEAAVEVGGSLAKALREAAGEVVQDWGQLLAELPVRLIEEPDFRLAGAEEAVRQLVATIEQVLEQHEPLQKDLAAQAREAVGRLTEMVRGRRGGGTTDPVELLHGYAKARYQWLVLGQVAAAFVTLRGHLADEMREINFCRVRLGELLRLLQESAAAAQPRPTAEAGRYIFPSGCKDLAAAVGEVLPAVGPAALRELDVRLEATLTQQFRALVHVCMSEANILPAVQRALVETACDWVGGLLPRTDVARVLLEQHHDDAQSGEELASLFDEAAPPLLCPKTAAGQRAPGAARGASLAVLAAPPGEAGDRLRALATDALPDTELHAARSDPNPDDCIVLYRESCHLPLAELDLLGPAGREAYAQMSGADGLTPHSRTDVAFVPAEVARAKEE
jgi:hypothetical protein